MKKYIKKYYIELLLITLIISFSLLNISKGALLLYSYKNHFNKQITWIIIGLLLSYIVYKIKLKTIYKYRYHIYAISILLLIYPLIFSTSVNKIKAWIKIGAFSFQPSELIKITYPLVGINLIKNKKYLLSFLLFLFPTILILLEPDTGNALLIFLIYIFLILNKKNYKYILFIILTILLLLISLLILFKLKPELFIHLFNGSLYYRLNRIITFKNNYQLQNSIIGIGSSKLVKFKASKLLIYIPEGITDFIYAFSICNYGITSGIMLVVIYLLFILKLIHRYKKTRYKYQKMLLASFVFIFLVQSFYNILMNIGLLPIIGIPLPLFSYGGSNIITYLIFYFLTTKKQSSILDKDNNNYKSNYHKVLVDM